MSCGFKKVNLVSMTRAATENDKNVSTKIVAPTFENDFRSAEVSGENVWKNFGYLDVRKSDYLMEKVNIPQNTLFYLNQSYLEKMFGRISVIWMQENQIIRWKRLIFHRIPFFILINHI